MIKRKVEGLEDHLPHLQIKVNQFVIKFPQKQTSKNKNKEILKHLNKDKDFEINFKNNIIGLKPENKIKEEQKNKKPYIESYNKIEDKPKNIFGDEEIEEDYGDFENVDEIKMRIKMIGKICLVKMPILMI